MIKSVKDLNNIPNELTYNKFTIIISTIIALSSYYYWEYTHGIVTWISYIFVLMLTLIIAFYSVIGMAFFGLQLLAAFMFIPTFLFYNFWDAITLNISEANVGDALILKFLLFIKQYFLAHPELGAFWTGIIFIILLWKHPKQTDENYEYDNNNESNHSKYANNPFSLIKSIIHHPSKLLTPIMMVLCGLLAYSFKSEPVIITILWLLLFCILRFFYGELAKKYFWEYFLLYCIIFVSIALFGGDNSITHNAYQIITLGSRMPIGLGWMSELKEFMLKAPGAAPLCGFLLPLLLKLTSPKNIEKLHRKMEK